MNLVGPLDALGRDLRYALRRLARRRAFTFAVVLTLALGIGATTAIFSVVYSVLIQPLSYPAADELVRIRPAAPGMNTSDLGSDSTMYLTYRDQNRTFEHIGMWADRFSATLIDRGESMRVPAVRVTDGTLEALGVPPMRGRWFTEQEVFGPPAEGVQPVILSYGFWQRQFGGDEAVLGRELTMDGGSGQWQVVGIMPRGFRFLDMTPQPDVIIPFRLDPTTDAISNFSFGMLARLEPGVTVDEARADVEHMLPIWLDAWPSPRLTREVLDSWQITAGVRPLKDDIVGSVSSALWLLLGAIGAVLVMACANIANLMLVRTDARRHEFAVRTAVGAGSGRIARELLIESFVLGAAGAVLGWALAHVGVQALVAVGPNDLPRLPEIAVHPQVLAFTVAISLSSTLVFGLITVFKHALHIDTPLRGLPRGSSATRERNATRNVLVVVQVGLALVLVVSAALMIRSFQALHAIDPGFSDPATIQTARIWMPPDLRSDGERMTRVQQETLERIAALPGVTAVGFTDDIPMGEQWDNRPIEVEGETTAINETPGYHRWNYVSPGFFGAMGTRILAGRDVTWSDIEAGGRVVLISEEFARELAVEPADALGRRVRMAFEETPWHEVIGVVQSVHHDGLYEEPPSTVYWPVLVANTFGQPNVTFAIRSERAGTASLMNEVRQVIESVHGAIPITLQGTMRDLYSVSLARTSFTLVLLAIAGGMALTLGVVGIYGVMAYAVSQRTRELGIRSALGADRKRLGELFLLHGLTLTGIGVLVGLVAAMALARFMSSLLFGITSLDPAAYTAALLIIFSAAALASYLPARRAAAVDPMETLRTE